jgi:hypothetical protein
LGPPEHLQLFSVGSIEALLTEAGFRRVRVLTHGFNLVEFLCASSAGANSDQGVTGPHRVQTGYQLDELISRSRARRALKHLINGMLNLSHLGDSLKIWAER